MKLVKRKRIAKATKREYAIGFNHVENQSIEVADDLAPDSERECALHEVLHSVFYLAGMGTGDHAEDAINRSSPIIYDMLRSNPKFVAYLLEKDNA